jgi:hypothetical protein
VNKLLKTLLRTGACFLDQADDARTTVRHRMSDRMDDLTDRATRLIRREEDHTARYALSFAAGIGLGLGAGLLFAPASGNQTREAISETLQGLGENVSERFSHAVKKSGIDTDRN